MSVLHGNTGGRIPPWFMQREEPIVYL